MTNPINYAQTIKYLKFSQIFYRLFYKFKPRKIRQFENFEISNCSLIFKIILKNSIIYKNKFAYFDFLGIKKKINFFEINEKKSPKLWIYNVHYFDYLNDNKNNKFYCEKKIDLIHHWISFIKKNHGSFGLDPYPTSLRIVNWIKWIINNNISDKDIISNLYSQFCYLETNIEYNILANHLIANAKALIFGGLFFKNQKSKLIYLKGINLLNKELKRQILQDGGHFEQSPMYHNIVTEDILDIYNILFSNNKKSDLQKLNLNFILIKLLNFSKHLSHPDGHVSFFNDSCFDIAPNFNELCNYSSRMKINFTNKKIKSYVNFKNSGYSVINKNNFYLIFDRANVESSYQAGHTHSDILSFELSFYKKRFLVNSGTNTYENNNLRLLQRGTSLHNTLTIKSLNSTNVWHSFRTGNRANIQNIRNIIRKEKVALEGSHDGYYSKFKAIHHRSIEIIKNSFIVVDKVNSEKKYPSSVYFYFYNNARIKQTKKNHYHLLSKQFDVFIVIEGDYESCIYTSLFYPSFGQIKKNKCLKISGLLNADKLIKTTFKFKINE